MRRKKKFWFEKKKKTKNAKSRNEILPSFFCPNFPIAKMLRVLSLDWESLLAPYDDLTLLQKSSSSLWASPEVEKNSTSKRLENKFGPMLAWLACLRRSTSLRWSLVCHANRAAIAAGANSMRCHLCGITIYSIYLRSHKRLSREFYN